MGLDSCGAAAKRWLTVPEAAKEIGISPRTAYDAIKRGDLRAVVRRGCTRGYRVSTDEIARYMDEGWEPVRV